jgi:hypothetical protein
MPTLVDVIFESRGLGPSSRKRKRAFHRLVSGLTRAHGRGEFLRVVTLTSHVGFDARRLSRCFQRLRRRIARDLHFWIEYWKINTSEGNGTVHLVYKAVPLKGACFVPNRGFIPQDWLSRVWSEITGGSFVVFIQRLWNRPRKLANYLLSQYFTGQPFERMSWSWSWVFRGFCHVWNSRFKSWFHVNPIACLKSWDRLIVCFSVSGSSVQGSLG